MAYTDPQKKKANAAAWYWANLEKRKATSAAWAAANPEKIKAACAKWEATNSEKRKAYRAANPEKVRTAIAAWAKANPEKRKAAYAKWAMANREKINAWTRRRRRENPTFRVLSSLRSRMKAALCGKVKSDRTRQLLGCEIPELRAWLEGWWEPGMSWENYGDWEIDHRRPCASFDLSRPEEQRRCFHYLNLQPLWKSDNRQKSDSYHANVG